MSIVVIAHNMRRELPRTLYTLSSRYQLDFENSRYEIIVVDNYSSEPLLVNPLDFDIPNIRFVSCPGPVSRSPAGAINYGVKLSSGELVMLCIDGARMLSPRILSLAHQALNARSNSIVVTLGWHLGPKSQSLSIDDGYNQVAEDNLLSSVDWRSNGYDLFKISSPAASSIGGWFRPISESNCICMSRSTYDALNGYDESFVSPGGGLVNLDFYRRACELVNDVVVLLGEGTFHQFHGGVSTNVPKKNSPFREFHDEYVSLRGYPFARPSIEPVYWGSMPPQCIPFLSYSASIASQ